MISKPYQKGSGTVAWLPAYNEPVSIQQLKHVALKYEKYDIIKVLNCDPPDHPFACDGCSLWPDTWIRGEKLYTACFWHDVRYWLGGGIKARWYADIELWKDLNRIANPRLAALMFVGVRICGSPFFYKDLFNWGFGRETI